MQQDHKLGDDAVSVADLYYRLLLGRPMNGTEKESLQSEDLSGDLIGIIRGRVLDSDEFFMANRETLLPKFFRKPCLVYARTPLGQEILVDLRQLHLGFAMASGDFEPAETAFIRQHVKRGMQICDIGANIGYYSTMFAALTGDSGSVFCFEPVSDTFAYLKAAIERNGLQHIARLYRMALSDADGDAEVVFERGGTNIGGAHLRFGVTHSDRHLNFEKVPAFTLDTILAGRRIDFIKIDVEGAEPKVLAGAKRTLAACRPTIMIEFNENQLRQVSQSASAELVSFFDAIGYRLSSILGDGRTELLADPQTAISQLLSATGVCNCVASPK